MCFRQGQAIPDPDGEVTKLEDSFFKSASSTSVNQLTTEMTKLSVTPGIILPVRPAFGTAGTPIVLWANYFALQVKKPQPLFKYGVTVEHMPPPGAVQKPEAKDAKLKKIIQAALRRIPNSGPIATEFKAQVISLKKLDMSDGVVQVEYTEPGRGRIENWNVKFGKPASIHVDELVSYLSHLRDPAGATQFPRYIEEIDALGVILGHQPRDDNQVVTVGRGRFFAIDPDRQEKATQAQDSLLSILRGYYQSVRPATGRLLLNVHVTHGIFRDGGSLRALFENHQVNKMHLALAITGQPWPDHARTMESKLGKLNKFLHKAKARVTVYYNSDRKPRIVTKVLCGIAHKTDKQKPDKEAGNKQKGEKGVKQEEVKGPRFTNPQGFPWACPYSTYFYIRAPDKDADRIAGIPYNDYISVAEYYRLRYNKKADPTLPLINYGTKSHPAYTLAELVELEPGQPLKAKLSGQEAQAMISFACRPPADNAISITERARALLHLDGNACIDSFGISVSKDLVTVRGRELPPPVLVYSGKRSVTPEDGGWLMKNIKVFQPGIKINQWVYAYPRDVDAAQAAQIKRTVQDFARFMLNTGIAIEPTPSGSAAYSGAGDFEDALRKTKRSQFVLVVLPRQDTILYNFIKQVCDVGLGIHSVCVVHAKFTSPKGQQGYFANVGLKVNLKMGGVNHSLQNEHKLIASGKTMLVGYDVTHPTNLGPSVIKTDKNGNKTGPPSIVGIVSSIDKHLGQWPAQSWNNRSGVEMLDDKLVEAFEKCLERWETSNNKNPKAPRKPLPENIVIFRDGVSEGQFNTVIETELPHITKACQRKYGKRPMPRISLIVSVKRHQTRFFPTDKNHIHFRSKSPKQGTVVDRGVTNVRFWDFFLQAHASLQGKLAPCTPLRPS
jgi:eukaryotic translation initiation factor 2C